MVIGLEEEGLRSGERRERVTDTSLSASTRREQSIAVATVQV
jgi:hypothetical protein